MRITESQRAALDQVISSDYCVGLSYSQLAVKHDVSVARVQLAMKRTETIARPNYNTPKAGYMEVTEDLAYIVGVIMGDGTLTHGMLKLAVVDRDFATTFKTAVEQQFGISCSVREAPPFTAVRNGHVYLFQAQVIVTLHCVHVMNFLRTIVSSKWVRALPSGHKIAWLRGAWDSEGSINWSGTSWVVRFSVRSRTFAKLFRDVLKEACTIEPRFSYYAKGDMWRLAVSQLNDVVRFYLITKPTIRRKCIRFEEAQRRLAVRTSQTK